MLNMLEMSDLWQFKDSLPEGHIKELLNNLLFEYSEYTVCGSPKDCKDRLEWMKMSPEDVRKNFNFIIDSLRDEVAYIREHAEQEAAKKYKPEPKKRGRPKKVKEESKNEETVD